tara:strand:+ start:1289 stop:4987 length:3699 start_codon:yes stop_codon:yes gene_type:complete
MAVIKESRQFKIGPVGVARASDLRESSRALSEAFSTVGKIQYERAARNALKVGEEAGESAIVIDPETGLPQPLIPPKGFGSIASDAYDRVARNRFEFSIQTEIELKGKELAAKYANNPNGSALYHQTMSDYVESMTEAAEGAGYKSYIADTGTAYRDLTTQKLAIKQQERERAEMITFAETAFTKGSNSVEALSASNPEEAAVIAEQSLQGVKDAVASNLLPKSAIKAAETGLMISKAKGIIRGLGPDVDPEHLARIEFAFDTANADLLPSEYMHLAPLIANFGNDFESIEKVANFATEHLRPIAILSAENVRKQEEIIAKAQSEDVFSLIGGMDAAGRNAAKSIRDSYNPDSEVKTWVAVGLSISNANRLDREAERAFLDSETNPANPALAQQYANTALTIRSASARSILLENNKSSGKFNPKDINGIIQFLDKGDVSGIKGLSASSTITLEMLSKVIKSDKTGAVRKESISLLTTIMDAGDKAEAINVGLGSDEVSKIKNKIRSGPFGQGVASIEAFMVRINEAGEMIEGARKNGLNDIADAQVEAIQEEAVAIAEATIDRSLQGLTSSQATQQLAAVQARNPNLSPTKESKEALEMLIALEAAYPKDGKSTIWSKTESATKSWRDGGAKFHDSQAKLQLLDNQDGAEALIAGMDIPNITFASTGLDTESFIESSLNTYANKNSDIINTPNATEKVVEQAQDALRASVTKSLFRKLLATDLNETQANQVVGYFNKSGSGDNLTAEQKSLIKEMSKYSNRVISKDLTKSLQSDMKGSLAEVRSKLVKQKLQNKKIANQNRLAGGGGNVLDSADRKDMDTFMFENGIVLSNFNQMDKNQQQIVTKLMTSVTPQSFFDAVDRMTNGLPVDGADSILNLYSIMSTGVSESTTAGVNWFGDQISLEKKALLDDAFSIVSIRGGDVQEILGQLVMKTQDPAAKGNLKNALGELETPYAFALDATQDPLIAIELTGIVRYLGLTQGSTTEMITKRIEAILDQKYPKSDFIVDSSRPISDVERSRFGLVATIPNEKIRNVFIETVNTEVSELSIKLQAIDSNFPELRMFTPSIFAPDIEGVDATSGRESIEASLASQRLSFKQFVTGNVMGNVYLEPDDTGAALNYRVYYADENNELVPLMYSSDVNGEPVKEGTEGAIANWVSYSVNGTVGDLIRDDEKSSEIKMRILLRKNAESQKATFAAQQALNKGQAGLESFARNQELTKRSQLFAPSELVGN